MTIAVVDIGANTVRSCVYKIFEGDELNKIFSKKNIVGLASYVEDGALSRKGIERLKTVLREQIDILHYLSVEDIHVFATASLRKVTNRNEILEEVKKKVGVDIQLLSDLDEARLGFAGIKELMGNDEGISIDIGGGSTEIVHFKKKKIIEYFNLDEGSLSMYSQFVSHLLPENGEIKKMRNHLETKLGVFNKIDKSMPVAVGFGGTIRALGNISYEYFRIPSTIEFKGEHVKGLIKDIKKENKDLFRTILQVAPARIHILTPGLIILDTLMDYFDVEKIMVSNYGLREGFALEKLSKQQSKT